MDAANDFTSWFTVADNGCWEFRSDWLAPNGYGQFSASGKHWAAHRFAWLLHHGTPPQPGCHVCHRCDNKRCVNPDHLFVGSARENVVDMVEKKRHRNQYREATHCKRGHLFTEQNTRIYNGNWRRCLACERASHKSRPKAE